MRVPMSNAFDEQKMTGEKETHSLKAIIGTVASGRITRGVYDCAHILETTPENVMLCILPETNSDDISINIQHKLIEAYCWENDIPVNKLDNTEDLAALLTTHQALSNNGRKNSEVTEDLSCVLINYPADNSLNSDTCFPS